MANFLTPGHSRTRWFAKLQNRIFINLATVVTLDISLTWISNITKLVDATMTLFMFSLV